jgi:hypothetical protein
MKWILFAIFHGSVGMGPTMTTTFSLTFDDRAACEAAADPLASITRRYRSVNAPLEYVCLRAGSVPTGAAPKGTGNG